MPSLIVVIGVVNPETKFKFSHPKTLYVNDSVDTDCQPILPVFPTFPTHPPAPHN